MPVQPLLFVLLVAAVLAAGCKRRRSPVEAVLPPPAELLVPPDPAGTADLDPAIRAAAQKYVAVKRAAPRSWVDLTVEQGYLTAIPQGADGKPLDFERTMARLGIRLEK